MRIDPFSVPGGEIVLEPVRSADATVIAEALQDPEIARWTTVPTPYRLEDAQEWTAAAPAEWEHGSPHWSVRGRDDGRLLGAITLFARGARTWEVGYWMGAEHRGRGHMTEALRLATQTAFERLGAERVEWKAIVGNWASWKPAWRNGFRREGTQRRLTDRRGDVRDHWTAAIVRGDLLHPAAPWDGPGAHASDLGPAVDSSRPQQLVAQFHRTYSMPDRVADGTSPTLDYDRLPMRMRLIAEEFSELVGAVWGRAARGIIEDAYRRAVEADDRERDLVETADALADLVYVIYGMAIESGIDLDAVLAEVQASNLSKLMPDGSVLLRADGKVLKGPGFFRPDVRRALGLPPVGPAAGPVGPATSTGAT